MEAHAKTIRSVLESSAQYLIPFFQRNYSWRRPHWDRLWTDITNLLEDGGNERHFMGPLVCTVAQAVPGQTPKFLLIDGQQRLTTLTVLLCVLRDLLAEAADEKGAAKIHEGYLVHRHEEGLDRYRVIPRTGDREALIAMIERTVEKQHRKSHLYKAAEHFRRCIEADAAASSNRQERLVTLFNTATDRLSLVVITIDGENPFEIFESLNSTGLPLEESDLIRNYLFMQVSLDKQEAFNDSHWRQFEALFQGRDVEAAKHATTFYRQYLMRNGAYSKSRSTFVDFKDQNRARNLAPDQQIAELIRYARFDRLMDGLDQCEIPAVRDALRQMQFLDITTARPLLLNLYDRFDRGAVDTDEFVGCLTDLASFVLRRSICSESTRSYGRWFVKAIESLGDNPRDDLRRVWFERGWPDDSHVLDRLRTFPLYSRESRKLRLILETIETSHHHKEAADLSKLTTEHVMPQTISGNKEGKLWQAMLGDDWKETHRSYLHTLGNLTLTGYNPKLSNKSYEWKQKEFANSHVVLNRHFKKVAKWNQKSIIARSEELAARVVELWPRPSGGPEYVPTPEFTEELQDFCVEYWSAVVERLQEAGFENRMDTHLADDFFWMKGRRKCFWYFAEIDVEQCCIWAGIYTSGGSATRYLQLLWSSVSDEQQEELEELLDSDLHWEENYCCAELLDVEFQDRAGWKHQHEWILNCIRTLDSKLSATIESIWIGDFDPGIRKDFDRWNAERYADDISEKKGPSDMEEDDTEQDAGITDSGSTV